MLVSFLIVFGATHMIKNLNPSAKAAALLVIAAVAALWILGPTLPLLAAVLAATPATLAVFHGVRLLQRFRGPTAGSSGGKSLDPRTGLPAGQAVTELGAPLLDRSRRNGEPLTVLVFDFADLADVEAIYGEQSRQRMLGIIGRRLRRLAGRDGLALRATKSRFLVLLPGRDRAHAMDHVAAHLGRHCSFEMESGEVQELLLVPRVTNLCATANSGAVERLLGIAQAEPERPVKIDPPRPRPVAPAAPAAKFEFDLPDGDMAYQPQPSTFPMPLR